MVERSPPLTTDCCCLQSNYVGERVLASLPTTLPIDPYNLKGFSKGVQAGKLIRYHTANRSPEANKLRLRQPVRLPQSRFWQFPDWTPMNKKCTNCMARRPPKGLYPILFVCARQSHLSGTIGCHPSVIQICRGMHMSWKGDPGTINDDSGT